MRASWEFETKSIHCGFDVDEKTGATTLPIYETAAYAYPKGEDLAAAFQGKRFGYIYSRIANPTVNAFEQRLNALENGRGAIATSSGMAAIATVFASLTGPGDEIISSQTLFGGTLQLFQEVYIPMGIDVKFVPSTDYEAYRKAVSPRTKVIFLEAIGNPGLDIPDIRQIAEIAAEHRIPLVVDATLATPYLLPSKAFGVNIVVHSTSKYITGNGSCIGGVLIDLGNYDWTKSRTEAIRNTAAKAGDFAFLARARRQILQNTGCCLSPFSAFLQNLGLETLALRMEKHCSNALALAEYLAGHPKISSVSYPGLNGHPHRSVANSQFNGRYGGLLTFRMGSEERCHQLTQRLKIVKNLANLGDAKTLIIHPASTIYMNCSENERKAAGIYPDLLRVSVGIENINDIIRDFEEALAEGLI